MGTPGALGAQQVTEMMPLPILSAVFSKQRGLWPEGILVWLLSPPKPMRKLTSHIMA